jgi:hypothetical protein
MILAIFANPHGGVTFELSKAAGIFW